MTYGQPWGTTVFNDFSPYYFDFMVADGERLYPEI